MKTTLLTLFLGFCAIFSVKSQTPFGPENNIDLNTGNRPYVVASGDLDGDNFIDIVIGTYDFHDFTGDDIYWYKNDGLGNFTIQTVVAPSFDYVAGLHIADLDGINGNDIIASSASGDKVVWFANNGSGGFGAETLIANLDGAGQVTSVDINNDTFLDLIAVGYDASKVVWYAGDGTGTFSSEKIIDDTASSGPASVSVIDFDGDTDLDVLIGYTGFDFIDDGYIEVFYNQYKENDPDSVEDKTDWVKHNLTVDSGDAYLYVTAFADVNDDGNPDIIKSDFGINDDNPGEVAWFNKEPDSTFTKTVIATSINNPAVVLVSKINPDNFTDIVISNGNIPGDEIIWFESSGAGTYLAEATISNEQQQVFGVTIADFNQDTKPDIASVDWQGFDLNWFENDQAPLSINDQSFNKIRIYPNPTANKLYFKSPLTENFNVSVFDVLGKKIMENSLNDGEALDVSKLHSGMYFLKFEGYNTTYRFVKQ